GIKETLNKGINIIDSEYIVRMDADDIAVNERLKWQIEFMDSNEDIGVCGGHFEFFGDEKIIIEMPLKDEEIKAKLFFFSGLCHPTVIIRTDVLKKNNILYGNLVLYNDDFGHKILELEDFALWHKLKHVTKFANIDRVLIKYRKEGQNISSKKIRDIYNRKKIFYYYLLKEIGINDPPEDELVFLYTLQYFKDTPNIENIKKYRLFLNKIIAANEYSMVYDTKYFEAAVNRIWAQFFYFVSTLKMRYVIQYWKVSGKIKKQNLVYFLKFKLNSIFQN
ncbi:MAG: glycosyltransferase, partial [Methanobacterium sp.]